MRPRPAGEREAALALLREVGPTRAAATLGISRNTIKSWGRLAGVPSGTATRECAAPDCDARFAPRAGQRFCSPEHRNAHPQCPTCGAPSRRKGRYCTSCSTGRENARALAKRGMTECDYEKLLAAQGGVCAICQQSESAANSAGGIKRLSVDHDHVSGAVRGLLCSRCNVALGMFDDDPQRLLAAAAYLNSVSL